MNLKYLCHTRTHIAAQALPQRDPKGDPARRANRNDERESSSWEPPGSNHTYVWRTVASVTPCTPHSQGPHHRDPHRSVPFPRPPGPSSGDRLSPLRPGPQVSAAGSTQPWPWLSSQLTKWPHLERSPASCRQICPPRCCFGSSAGKPRNQLYIYKERDLCPGQASQAHSGLWLHLQVSQHLQGLKVPHPRLPTSKSNIKCLVKFRGWAQQAVPLCTDLLELHCTVATSHMND